MIVVVVVVGVAMEGGVVGGSVSCKYHIVTFAVNE